jgi:hypothetical protein
MCIACGNSSLLETTYYDRHAFSHMPTAIRSFWERGLPIPWLLLPELGLVEDAVEGTVDGVIDRAVNAPSNIPSAVPSELGLDHCVLRYCQYYRSVLDLLVLSWCPKYIILQGVFLTVLTKTRNLNYLAYLSLVKGCDV